MKVVITYGTFDLLHLGHIRILKKAKQQGDYLIVGLSTDSFNAQKKAKKCVQTYEERKEILEAIRYVDEVIPENNWQQKRADIKKHDVDLFVMGGDWEGKFDDLKDCCEVRYFPRTEGVSTTQRKSEIKRM